MNGSFIVNHQIFQLSLWNVVAILFVPVITGLPVHHICKNHFFIRLANGDDEQRVYRFIQSYGVMERPCVEVTDHAAAQPHLNGCEQHCLRYDPHIPLESGEVGVDARILANDDEGGGL